MSSTDTELEQKIETQVRLRQLEKEEQETEIEQRLAEQRPTYIPSPMGPTYIGVPREGGGIANTIMGLGVLAVAGGIGYYAYTNGYLSSLLGPFIKGPGTANQGSTYKYQIIGLTPGGSYTQEAILSDGSQRSIPSSGSADPTGQASVSLSIDQTWPLGVTVITVTDTTTGKKSLLAKKFTILAAGSTGTGGGGGTTGSYKATGTVVLNLNGSESAVTVAQDGFLHWSATGLTPGALIEFGFDLNPSPKVGYSIADTATADASGQASGSVQLVPGVHTIPGSVFYAFAFDANPALDGQRLGGYSQSVAVMIQGSVSQSLTLTPSQGNNITLLWGVPYSILVSGCTPNGIVHAVLLDNNNVEFTVEPDSVANSQGVASITFQTLPTTTLTRGPAVIKATDVRTGNFGTLSVDVYPIPLP